jgi:RNA polymerase sigma-70 factor (ECF subfamily)
MLAGDPHAEHSPRAATAREEQAMAASSEAHGWVLEAVDRFEQPLTRYARRLLGDVDLAADAVQHAFVMLCGESRARVENHVAPWLFRVCRNRALDHLRRAGRERALDDDAAGPAAVGVPADRRPDPAAAAEAHELAARLRLLLKDLPAAQRETIDLWCEGFSYREIAGISGRTEGHVRVLAHRGLSALRSHPLVRDLLPASITVTKAQP